MTLDERVPIDPNTADQETLCLLPGAGPVLSERMIAARPFGTLEELTRVSGIGANTVERWRSLLALPPAAEPDAGDVGSRDGENDAVEESAAQMSAVEDGRAGIVEAERVTAKIELDAVPDLPAEPAPDPEVKEEKPEPSAQVPEEEPPAPEQAVPGKPPARRRPMATRRYVGCLVVAGGTLVLVLSLALSLGILARLNDNQLQFASPAQINALALRVEGLETQAEGLARDVDGLRTRLSNVEAIGERMRVLEQTAEMLRTDLDAASERLSVAEGATEVLQTDVDAAATRVAELSAQVGTIGDELSAMSDQVDDLGTDVETLQAESGRFQTFLDGLQALMDSLFSSQGGQ